MRLNNCMAGWMATALLAVATLMPAPCLAQRNNWQHNNVRPMQDGREGKIVRQAAPGKGMPATGSGTIRDYPRANGSVPCKTIPVSVVVSGAPADVAAASAALLKSSAATAAAHAKPDGNLGTPHARSETGSAGTVRQDAAASSRAPAYGWHCGARSARYATGQREQIIDSNRFRGFLAPGARHHARRHPAAAGSSGEWQIRRTSGSRTIRHFCGGRSQWKSCETVSALVTNSGSTRSALTEITLS